MQGTEKMCYYGSVFGWYGWKAIGEFQGRQKAIGRGKVLCGKECDFGHLYCCRLLQSLKIVCLRLLFCDWSAAVFQIIDVCCFSKYALQYIAS